MPQVAPNYRTWGNLLSGGQRVWTSLPRGSQARSDNAGPPSCSEGAAFPRTWEENEIRVPLPSVT